jgi:hypothetical protein
VEGEQLEQQHEQHMVRQHEQRMKWLVQRNNELGMMNIE